MAPRLDKHMHQLILAKIRGDNSNQKIAKKRSSRQRTSYRRIRKTYAWYGTTVVPAKRTGPDPKITPLMQGSLHVYLANDQSKDALADGNISVPKFGVDVSVTAISRESPAR